MMSVYSVVSYTCSHSHNLGSQMLIILGIESHFKGDLAGLNITEWAVSSVVMHQRCCRVYHDENYSVQQIDTV